jgi:hypothetical protein
MVEVLRLLAGQKSSGSPVFEEVLAEPLAKKLYRLLKSPGLVLGLAARDIFELLEDGKFYVVERGGNLCVQIFARSDLNAIEQVATEQLSGLGGYLDGVSELELVYTVPVAGGFSALEVVLNGIAARFPGAEWYYGNVYDTADGVTPLQWWAE